MIGVVPLAAKMQDTAVMPAPIQFSRSRIGNRPPKLSVICLNKNHAAYLEDNLLSVAAQKFDDFEYLVADGGSTDASLSILGRYEFAFVLPGSDTSRDDGVLRAAAATAGTYIMFTTSTDGYLCRNWFKTAVDALDGDPEVGLVWAASVAMGQDGTLGRIAYPKIFDAMPQKRDWFFRWLFDNRLSRSYIPELNYCVRGIIFRECVKETSEFSELNNMDPILRFLFRFNREGYLARYMPVLASFGRHHSDNFQNSEYIKRSLDKYCAARARYRAELLKGTKQHVFRDARGSPIEVLKHPRQIKRPRKSWSEIKRTLIDLRRSLRP